MKVAATSGCERQRSLQRRQRLSSPSVTDFCKRRAELGNRIKRASTSCLPPEASTSPARNSLTNAVALSSSRTVPLRASVDVANLHQSYNGSHQYNYAAKHDGQLFFSATNGGTTTTGDFSTSNPEAKYYAPLEQLSTDLTNNTVGRYNFITPDQYNDMHTALSGGFTYNGIHYTGDSAQIAQGDNFFRSLCHSLWPRMLTRITVRL